MRTEKPLKTHEMEQLRKILQEKTGVWLKPYLVQQAFTRSSYARSHGGGSNENFEFIGDTIIGYNVVQKLFFHYGTIQTDSEGWWYYAFRAQEKDLSALRSRVVSNRTLAGIIDTWDVCDYLIVGKQDLNNAVDRQEKIKADLFEAIIGACAVQFCWNQDKMREIVEKVLPIEEFILSYEKENFRNPEFTADNAINTLKELAEHEKCSPPVYDAHGPEAFGNDKNGKPIWSCSCTVRGERIIAKQVFAHSKKDAKKYAAYLVLCDMFDLSNQIGPCKLYASWGFDGEKLTPNPNSEYLEDF